MALLLLLIIIIIIIVRKMSSSKQKILPTQMCICLRPVLYLKLESLRLLGR